MTGFSDPGEDASRAEPAGPGPLPKQERDHVTCSCVPGSLGCSSLPLLAPWADRGSRKEIRVQCEGYCSNSDKREEGVLVEQAYK